MITSIRLHEGSRRPSDRLTTESPALQGGEEVSEPELLRLLEENSIETDATRGLIPEAYTR
jgi:hypothetical protein